MQAPEAPELALTRNPRPFLPNLVYRIVSVRHIPIFATSLQSWSWLNRPIGLEAPRFHPSIHPRCALITQRPTSHPTFLLTFQGPPHRLVILGTTLPTYLSTYRTADQDLALLEHPTPVVSDPSFPKLGRRPSSRPRLLGLKISLSLTLDTFVSALALLRRILVACSVASAPPPSRRFQVLTCHC